MVVKKHKDLFLSALVIVVAIFLLGLYLGYHLDTFRVDDTRDLLRKTAVDTDSLLVENEFLETFDIESCTLVEQRLQLLGDRLFDLGKSLSAYDTKKVFRSAEYRDLKQQYFSLEIKAFSLYYQAQEECIIDKHVVLYFYDVEDNEESLRQGFVLDSLVARLDNVIVLSIDREFEDPLLETVKSHFAIVSGPSLVVDFEHLAEGFVSFPELVELLGEDV